MDVANPIDESTKVYKWVLNLNKTMARDEMVEWTKYTSSPDHPKFLNGYKKTGMQE